MKKKAVEQSRRVLRNAPVIAGTRIPTAAVKRYKEAGFTVEQILAEYPDLTRQDVEAALKFEENKRWQKISMRMRSAT